MFLVLVLILDTIYHIPVKLHHWKDIRVMNNKATIGSPWPTFHAWVTLIIKVFGLGPYIVYQWKFISGKMLENNAHWKQLSHSVADYPLLRIIHPPLYKQQQVIYPSNIVHVATQSIYKYGNFSFVRNRQKYWFYTKKTCSYIFSSIFIVFITFPERKAFLPRYETTVIWSHNKQMAATNIKMCCVLGNQ